MKILLLGLLKTNVLPYKKLECWFGMNFIILNCNFMLIETKMQCKQSLSKKNMKYRFILVWGFDIMTPLSACNIVMLAYKFQKNQRVSIYSAYSRKFSYTLLFYCRYETKMQNLLVKNVTNKKYHHLWFSQDKLVIKIDYF